MAGNEGSCGECGGPVVERLSTDELDSSYDYRKKCSMCNEMLPFHEKCAKYCASNHTANINKGIKYTAEAWCKSDAKYLCKINCMTACFICEKKTQVRN